MSKSTNAASGSTIENRAYIKAIDQLAFGVIILNERGHVVRVNETAIAMLDADRPGCWPCAGNVLTVRPAMRATKRG